MNQKQWAVGVTSAPRQQSYLQQTVSSIVAAGFPSPIIFHDGADQGPIKHARAVINRPRLGGWPTFLLAVADLANRSPNADYFAIVQDDVIFSKGARAYLDRQTFPKDAGLVSIFCPQVYNGPPGFNAVAADYGLAGAQTFIFPNERVWQFLSDSFVVNHRRKPPRKNEHFRGDGLHHIDGVCGEFCRRNKLRPYYHSPSLAKHIGHESAMYPGIRRNSKAKRIFDNTFLGESFDLTVPLIVALMVTGKDETRKELALKAIEDFNAQTYNRKRLLILNDSETAPWFPSLPGCHEVTRPKIPTLGEARNKAQWLALKLGAELLIQWDDDDRYAPERIAYQVAQWRPGMAVVLKRQTKSDLTTGKTIVCERATGIEGTILYEAKNPPKYPSTAKGEDTVSMRAFGRRLVVAENKPEVYTRQYHGANTWDQNHVMRKD